MDKITDSGAMKAAQVTETSDALPKPLARYTGNISIKINDHVTFCDKYDIIFRGIVKWIGTEKSSDIVVGIEVVRDNYHKSPLFCMRKHLRFLNDKMF